MSFDTPVAIVESGQPIIETLGPFFIPVFIFCFGVIGYLFLYAVTRIQN